MVVVKTQISKGPSRATPLFVSYFVSVWPTYQENPSIQVIFAKRLVLNKWPRWYVFSATFFSIAITFVLISFGMIVLFCSAIFFNTLSASSVLPRAANHRGDSGIHLQVNERVVRSTSVPIMHEDSFEGHHKKMGFFPIEMALKHI